MTIGGIADILLGFVFKSADFAQEPTPYRLVRGDNVKRGRIEWGAKTRYWDSLDPELEKFLLRDGDIVIGMDGSRVGENFAVLSQSDLPALLVQRVACLRGRDGVDQTFLKYAVCNETFTRFVKANQTGTSIPHVSGRQIASFEVDIPPLLEQRAIARILGTLDDKIELNRRMNETLEAMARALFKSWFVDFEPVRAKMEGRDTGLPEHIVKLFPDRMVESDIGFVPVGWPVVELSTVIDINPKRSLPRGKVAPYLAMANMPTRGHKPQLVAERAAGSGARFANGDTLLARITPCLENGKIAYVDFLRDGEIGWGSTEYIVLRSKPPLPNEFSYLLARNADFQDFAVRNMSGTSGRQRVSADTIGRYMVVNPPLNVSKSFGVMAEPFLARASQAVDESHTLGTLRDALLPQLLSGSLRVGDEKQSMGSFQ